MLTDLDYELLSAYIDGALTDSERAAFELRLQSEPELSRELDEIRATVTLINNLPVRKAPRDFTLDARYARRSSFFLTSATFSALSTAAAIILFALGAYLFTGNKSSLSTAAPAQVGQAAFLPSATAATMDKAADATLAVMQNEISITEMPLATSIPSDELAANSAIAQPTSTVELTLGDQPPPVEGSIAQATFLPTPGAFDGSSLAATEILDDQRSTSEVTETTTFGQYAAPAPNASTGGAADSSPVQVPETDTNTVPSFAATQLPSTATAASSPTALLKATLAPTATDTNTATPQSTATQTLLPTTPPKPVVQETPTSPDALPLLLMGLGATLLIIALGTTIARRRNRP